MKIVNVDNMIVSIPLKKTVKTANHTFYTRDFNVIVITTDEGIQGFSYVRGGETVHSSIESLIPIIKGKDPFMTEKLWHDMYYSHLMQGRKGAIMRAISAIDIALWDIKGKVTNKSVAHLLGGYREEIPCYVSIGYYFDGETTKDLAIECEEMLKRGFNAFKIRVAGKSLKEDLERIQVVRDVIGYDLELMVDANNGYNDHSLAIRAGRRFEDYQIRWLEEPTMPDNLEGSSRVTNVLDIPIAIGEQECTRFGFRDIIEKRAADILQPDVTVVGGISEWMKVSSLASTFHYPIAPHYFFDIHLQCAAASESAIYLEYFPSDSRIISFDSMLEEPVIPQNSLLKLPSKPGLGIHLNLKKLKEFRKV